jgi:PAS domain S-box-containing protein
VVLYYYLYIIFLAIGIFVSLFLFARLWKIRKTPGAINLLFTIFCVAFWSFANIWEIAIPSFSFKLVAAKAEYLGISFLALSIFSFALVYSGRGNWLTRGRLVLLSIIPSITLFLAFTNDWHHLLWSYVEMPQGSLIGPVSVGHGPWYIVNVVYQYALLLISTMFFIQIAIKNHQLYRTQAIIILTGMMISWVGNIIYLLRLSPVPGLDWTPLTFTFSIVAFEIGFARFGLMDVLPITQSSAFNSMLDGIVVADLRGRVVEINTSALNIFQKQSNQIIGQDIQQLLPAWVQWNMETSTAFEIGHEIVLGDGPNKRNFSLRIAPILNQRGRTTGHITVLTDITDQKVAEAHMLLQVAALEAARNGIVITDFKGKILWVNPAFTVLTGFSLEEAIGNNPRILKSNKQSHEYYGELWQTITSGKVWHGELINRRKDGMEYYEEMTITPLIQQPEGNITNFIAIKQDISNRKKTEEEIRLAHQEAIEANRMKTQLLANVSHDLRTPLGAIMGYSEMLEKGVFGNVNAEQKNAASEILNGSNQLLAFVNNLIGEAQIETGRLVIRPAAFKPKEFVAGAQSIAGYAIKKKNLKFEVEIAPELPEEIYGDVYWLKQILLNLINNATKFTEKGSIKVCLDKVDKDNWAIQVTDTGPGIPREAQKMVFEAFRQVEGNTRGGSGLGLSIVSQLTALMKGKIELKSQVGEGSTFTVILPLQIP